jgi:L-fucose isomerase-like protein
MTEPFLLLPVASGLHDQESLRTILSGFELSLMGIGAEPIEEADLERPLPLLILTLTGGTERRIIELVEARHVTVPGEPVTLVAHPGQNSLPAALEALARVQQLGGRGRIVFMDGPDDPTGLAAVEAAADDAAVWTWMHSARIGLVGEPSDWLVASSPDAGTVRASWGPEVVPIPMEEIEVRYQDAGPAAGRSLSDSVGEAATLLVGVERPDVALAGRLYPALAGAVHAHDLDAFTVRCFDLLRDLKTSGCLAIAQLNDDGIVAGCEGDLVSAVAMMWVRQLLGATPWMANPARIDPAGGEVLLAHCTIAPSLVEGFALRTHFESGIGVGIAGDVPAGDVTLVRIGGSDMDRIWIAEGTVTPHAPLEDVCRTQMHVTLDRPELARRLLEQPFGNHIVAIPGRHAERLAAWWRWAVAPNSPIGA